MTTRKIAVDEAEASDLREFAATKLGLEVTGKETRQQMLAKLSEVGFAMSHIIVGDAAPQPVSSGSRNNGPYNVKHNEKTGHDEACIIIHTVDKPGGDRPVPVGVNGKMMLVPRGEKVWVPLHYIEVLEHAEEFIYPEYVEGLGGLGEPRVVKAYPFSYA